MLIEIPSPSVSRYLNFISRNKLDKKKWITFIVSRFTKLNTAITKKIILIDMLYPGQGFNHFKCLKLRKKGNLLLRFMFKKSNLIIMTLSLIVALYLFFWYFGGMFSWGIRMWDVYSNCFLHEIQIWNNMRHNVGCFFAKLFDLISLGFQNESCNICTRL